jgi:hypothetical protein
MQYRDNTLPILADLPRRCMWCNDIFAAAWADAAKKVICVSNISVVLFDLQVVGHHMFQFHTPRQHL